MRMLMMCIIYSRGLGNYLLKMPTNAKENIGVFYDFDLFNGGYDNIIIETFSAISSLILPLSHDFF